MWMPVSAEVRRVGCGGSIGVPELEFLTPMAEPDETDSELILCRLVQYQLKKKCSSPQPKHHAAMGKV
jgi:hypothetical protein